MAKVSDNTGYSIDEILDDVRSLDKNRESGLLDELFREPEDVKVAEPIRETLQGSIFDDIADEEEFTASEDTAIIESIGEERLGNVVVAEKSEEAEKEEAEEMPLPESGEEENGKASDEEDEIPVFDEEKKDDFSFEKMYEEKKEEKKASSKTKVFRKSADGKDLSYSKTKIQGKDEPVSEKEAELEREFKKNRKEKIDKFRLFTENLSGDSYGEEEEESVNVTDVVKVKRGDDLFKAIENTDKPKKENSKRREKRKQRDSKVYDKIDVGRVKLRLEEEARDIKLRLIVALVSFVLSLALGVMKSGYIGGKMDFLSGFMANPVIVYALEFVIGMPMLVLALRTFFLRLRDSEKPTLSAVAMTAVVLLFNAINNAVLVLTKPEIAPSVMLFGTAVSCITLIEAWGEKKENLMIKKNLASLVRNETILGVFALENESEKLASGISKSKEPMVLCAGEVEIPNSFLDSSKTKDKENAFFNIAVPASVLLSLVCGVIGFVTYGGIGSFSSAALSALLVSSPVFISPVLISLIARVNESLNRTGCEILGYEDVENIDDTDAIVLDTADIFTGNISHFHLISRNVRIDTLHAFEIACSVLYSSGGVLKGEIAEFMKEQKLVLPEVEDIKYEEKLGISCWVEDKCVLLGTEKMMKEHNIEIPPEYSGEKYEREGSQVFYLAVDTYATAMFCADYFIGRQARKQLVDLYKTGVILMLMTTDPHIDEQFVANTLGVSSSSIKTVSPVGAKAIRESIEATTKQKRTGLIFRKNVVGLLKVINAAFRLYDVQSLAILIQIVSMVFGIVVSGVLSAAATGYLPGVVFIIAYHAIWTALGYFVTHKNKK